MKADYDIVVLLITFVIWAAVVLPDYALAQHLRATLYTKNREDGLYHYTRQTWEARFLIWGAISGGFAGIFTKEVLNIKTCLVLLLTALVGVLLIGFASMLIASRAGYGEDISDHPSRAVAFSTLGIAVYMLACVSVKSAQGKAPLLAGADVSLTTLATLVGIIGGIVSIVRALSRE